MSSVRIISCVVGKEYLLWPVCSLDKCLSLCPSSFCPPLCSLLDSFQPGWLIFQCHIFLPFHIVNGVLTARILERFAISLPGTTFCQNFPLWPVHLGWPCMASFRVHWVMRALLPWQGCDPWMGWEYCLWAIIKHFPLINKGMSYLLFFWTWLCHHGMPLWWTSCQHKNI